MYNVCCSLQLSTFCDCFLFHMRVRNNSLVYVSIVPRMFGLPLVTLSSHFCDGVCHPKLEFSSDFLITRFLVIQLLNFHPTFAKGVVLSFDFLIVRQFIVIQPLNCHPTFENRVVLSSDFFIRRFIVIQPFCRNSRWEL